MCRLELTWECLLYADQIGYCIKIVSYTNISLTGSPIIAVANVPNKENGVHLCLVKEGPDIGDYEPYHEASDLGHVMKSTYFQGIERRFAASLNLWFTSTTLEYRCIVH